MQRMMFAVLALTALVAAAPHRDRPAATADEAGNRMFDFAAPAAAGRDPLARHCTADRLWCAQLRRGAAAGSWRFELIRATGAVRRLDIPPVDGDAERDFTIWPHLVVARDGTIVAGVLRRKGSSYPNGDMEVTNLILILAEAAGPIHQVAEPPMRGYISMPNCLHPGDRRLRFGACLDQAEFTGTLRLDPATRTGWPRLLYSARARTFPARGVLESDLDTQTPLRRSEVRWAIDPTCTYQRRIRFRARQYVATDGPFLSCPDYFGH